MSHYEKVKCSHCVNGFVMTGFGPKPCMHCHGKGYILVEVEDDYIDTDNSSYSESSYSESYSDSYEDEDEDSKATGGSVRPIGLIASLVIFYVVIKNALIPADWNSIGPYIAVVVLLYIGLKLSFR